MATEGLVLAAELGTSLTVGQRCDGSSEDVFGACGTVKPSGSEGGASNVVVANGITEWTTGHTPFDGKYDDAAKEWTDLSVARIPPYYFDVTQGTDNCINKWGNVSRITTMTRQSPCGMLWSSINYHPLTLDCHVHSESEYAAMVQQPKLGTPSHFVSEAHPYLRIASFLGLVANTDREWLCNTGTDYNVWFNGVGSLLAAAFDWSALEMRLSPSSLIGMCKGSMTELSVCDQFVQTASAQHAAGSQANGVNLQVLQIDEALATHFRASLDDVVAFWSGLRTPWWFVAGLMLKGGAVPKPPNAQFHVHAASPQRRITGYDCNITGHWNNLSELTATLNIDTGPVAVFKTTVPSGQTLAAWITVEFFELHDCALELQMRFSDGGLDAPAMTYRLQPCTMCQSDRTLWNVTRGMEQHNIVTMSVVRPGSELGRLMPILIMPGTIWTWLWDWVENAVVVTPPCIAEAIAMGIEAFSTLDRWLRNKYEGRGRSQVSSGWGRPRPLP